MNTEKGLSKGYKAIIVFIVIGVAVTGVLIYSQQKPSEKKLRFGATIWQMFGVWEEACVDAGKWYASDHGYELSVAPSDMSDATAITDIRSFIEMGVDAIMVGAVSPIALCGVVEEAVSVGIPVSTYTVDVESEKVAFTVGPNIYEMGAMLSEEIKKYLRDDVEPIGDVKGLIINVQGPQQMVSVRVRRDALYDTFEDYPDVEIIDVCGEHSAATAETNVLSCLTALQADSRIPDVIYSSNGAQAIGLARAVEMAGLKAPRESENHIFVATYDASPAILDMIREEEIDVGVSWTPQFLMPLQMELLKKYIEEGPSAIPDVGGQITTDDILITGENHKGVDVWKYQTWAPAVITMSAGHKQVTFLPKLITSANVDDPTNWGNIYK